MNEYVIRNGFVESAATEMLGLSPGLRDYVRNEFGGRVCRIKVAKKVRSRRQFRIHVGSRNKKLIPVPVGSSPQKMK